MDFISQYSQDMPPAQILWNACCQNELEAVRTILTESRDQVASTLDLCLHSAAGLGHTEVVVLLLEHGANLHVRNSHRNWTPYQVAFDNGQRKVCDILLRAGAQHEDAGPDIWEGGAICPGSTSGLAARFLTLANRGEVVQCAEMLKLDPVLRDSQSCIERWYAIHVAAQNGHVEVVRLLLDAGLDVNTVTHLEETAFYFAEMGGHRELLRLLQQRGGAWGPL